MSAWIVSKQHIDHIVTAVIRAELSDRTPDDIGRMLWGECLASVKYRYPRARSGHRPGPAGFKDSDIGRYTWAETAELTPGGLAKTLGCYQYQSCEHPGWDGSEAEVITSKLRDALGDVEYDDRVPWGW